MFRLTTISVQGMTCTACSNSINDALRQLEGIEEADVLLLTDECKVVYNPEFLDAEKIRTVIEDCGFDATVLEERPLDARKSISSCIGTAVITTSNRDEVEELAVRLRDERGIVGVERSKDFNELHVKYEKGELVSNELLSLLLLLGVDTEKVEIHEYSDEVTEGLDVKEGMVQLQISGMTCGSCTSAIEGALQQLDGIHSADVSLVTDMAKIEYNKGKVGIRDIVRTIQDCGFDVSLPSATDKDAKLKIMSKAHELLKWKRHSLQSLLVAVLVMMIYMIAPMVLQEVGGKFPYVQTPVPGLFYRDVIGFLLATYLHLTVGSYFYHSSRKVLSHGSGTMDTLIFVSTSAAYAFSIFSIVKNIFATANQMPNVIFDTSVMLFAFVSIGKLLENKAKAHTLDSLKGFVSLTPATCIIREPSSITREIPVEFLQVNDIIEIKPGMKIPADGIVLEGQSEVNEACLTGESMLVPKKPNSKVICGSVNGPGYFLYRATDVGEDTRVAKIIATMKDAQMMKLPIQKYVDFMASRFVPLVLMLSLITFMSWLFICYILRLPPKLFQSSEEGSFYMCLQAAISVIVVACPCALGLAAPTALVVGTGIGATNSILFKSGEAIEKCSKVNAFMLDKTGTITTGELSVINFKSFIDRDKITPEYWALMNFAEKVSDHPIARALVSYTNAFVPEFSQDRLQLAKHEVIVGQGVRSLVEVDGNNYDVVIGSSSMMPHKIEHSTSTTECFVSINGTVVCVFEFGAMLKKDAFEVVQHLLAKGYYVGMLTGDNHNAAIKVAQEVGIPLKNVYSGVLPESKAAVLQQLKDEYNYKVAFVGDGINDSPALAVSDFGVSFSTGTELAMEASDVVILEEPNPDMASLKRLVYLLDISEKTFQRLKMNIFWAVFYNTFMIPISMGVLLPWGISLHPLAAGAGMALSSVSVIASSLLLKKWSPPDISTAAVSNNKSNTIWTLWKRLSSAKSKRAEEIEMQEGFLSGTSA